MPLYVGSTAVHMLAVGDIAPVAATPPQEPNLSWTPAAIQSSLHMWLDASEVSTLAMSSNAVLAWADRSGNNRNASQGTTANRPVVGILNRRTALSFDGTNDFFSLDAPLPNASSGSMSIFAVGAPNLTGRGSTYAGEAGLFRQYSATGDPAGSWFAGYDTHGRIGVTHHLTSGGNAAGGVRGPTGQIVSLSPTLLYWQYDSAGGATSAARWSMRVNAGAEVTEATTDTSSGWGEANGEIGRSYPSGAYHYRGLLAEIVVCNVALSTANRQRVEGYLAWKWRLESSLPADHPHKSQPPSAAINSFSLVPSGWIGAGTSASKLASVGNMSWPHPADAFRSATLTAATNGTLRITGTADDNGDGHETIIVVGGVTVWNEYSYPPPINITRAITAGQQVQFIVPGGAYFRSVQIWIE